MPDNPAHSDEPSFGAAAVPPGLPAATRQEIAEGQAAMRALVARLPRHFPYAAEVDFSFRHDHDE